MPHNRTQTIQAGQERPMSTETQAGSTDAQTNGRRSGRRAHGHRQPHRADLRAADHRRHGARHRPAPDQGRPRRIRADVLRPGVHEHGVLPQRDHLHRRRRRDPPAPRLPDRAALRALHLPRGRLPADQRPAAQRGRAAGLDRRDHDPHVRARERQGLHAGLPLRREPDGHAGGLGRRALDLLPGRQQDPRGARARDPDHPPAREDADAGGVRLPPQHGPALRLPRQRPRTTRATSWG